MLLNKKRAGFAENGRNPNMPVRTESYLGRSRFRESDRRKGACGMLRMCGATEAWRIGGYSGISSTIPYFAIFR